MLNEGTHSVIPAIGVSRPQLAKKMSLDENSSIAQQLEEECIFIFFYLV